MADMVKVKLAGSRAGHKFDAAGRYVGDFVQAAGEIVEMPENEAKNYIDRGMASAVVADPKRN
jgi:hypothetical protein